MGPSGLDVTWHVSFFPSVVISSLPQHLGFDKPLRYCCCLLEFDNPRFQIICLQWDTSIYQRASSLVFGGNSYYLQNAGSITHLGDFHINFKSLLLCVSGFMCLACGTWCVCVYVCLCTHIHIHMLGIEGLMNLRCCCNSLLYSCGLERGWGSRREDASFFLSCWQEYTLVEIELLFW